MFLSSSSSHSGGRQQQEVNAWSDKLAEVDRKKGTFQDMAAEGLLTFEELRIKLAELEKIRAVAEKEIEALRRCRGRVEEIDRDGEALLNYYAEMVPEALEGLTPQERHRVYRMLGLRVAAEVDDTLAVSGILREPSEGCCDTEPTCAGLP
ncbi:MAG: hypothetical protein M3157_00330 [Actinomycetota bacterium]|nr:hypothetical protein [Actinomycetota bacterium]